jgi:SAM-dependent methyltransferase
MSWGAAPELVGPRHRFRVGLMLRLLASYLPAVQKPAGLSGQPTARVLDAGAGRGTLSRALATRGYRVVALEESAAFVDYLRRGAAMDARRSPICVVRGDVAALPFVAGQFAAVVCGEVLEHLADDAAAVAEVARVLIPGGLLVATVPAGRARYGWLDRWAGHARRYDLADLGTLVRGAGFCILRLHHWGFPFGLLYERWVQRPVLARHARRGVASAAALRLGRAALVNRGLGTLFAVDAACDTLPWGPGLVLVARRTALTPGCASLYPRGEAERLHTAVLEDDS